MLGIGGIDAGKGGKIEGSGGVDITFGMGGVGWGSGGGIGGNTIGCGIGGSDARVPRKIEEKNCVTKTTSKIQVKIFSK